MKSFFKIVFASIIGFIISIMVFIILAIIIVGAIASGTDKGSSISNESILHLTLNQSIPDRNNNNPFGNIDFLSFSALEPIGLNEILQEIAAAKNDNNIKGVFLDLSTTPNEFASIEEIRNQLLDFKKSGKFIYAYADFYSQPSYYIATAADSIFLNPKGILEFKGLHTSLAFFKDALDKIGVDIQVIRHGKFKGAVEPFMANQMSSENREQIKTFTSSIWNYLLGSISKQRNISVEQLNNYANLLEVSSAKDAYDKKMIDRLVYRDEVYELLKTRTNQKSVEDVKLVTLYDYETKLNENSTNKIAIIFAEGEISHGKNEPGSIGSEDFIKTIREARLNKDIKSIVIRINSPGGSALASEIMWREIELAKKAKPVIVSMGNLAASGGYYIACNAHTIVANPTTITGSIGVFGILPNAKKLLNDKLGIHIDVVSTNQHADIAMPYRALDEFEKNKITEEVNIIYNDFISRVANGRKMTIQAVDDISQGRVWSALDAKNKGLIDELGGLNKAIEIAATKAKIKDFSIVEMPETKSSLEIILETFEGKAKAHYLKEELEDTYIYYKQIKSAIKQKGIQAKLPYELILN